MSQNETSAPDQPVVALIEILKEQLELDCDFSLQTYGKLTAFLTLRYHKKPVFIIQLCRIPVLLH